MNNSSKTAISQDHDEISTERTASKTCTNKMTAVQKIQEILAAKSL